MKIFLFSMLSISIIVLSLQACKPGADNPTGQVIAPDNVGGQEADDHKIIGILDRPDAKKLVQEYRAHFGTLHSKAVWFDRSFIKLLYDSLYETPGRFDGVRVYFGVYPEGFGEVNRAYYNQLTLFFVPTMRGTYNEHPMSIDTFIYKREQIMGLNHGELCPNNCDSLNELHLGH